MNRNSSVTQENRRIPIIVAGNDCVSGVTSWAYRLRKIYENDACYRVLVMGCRTQDYQPDLFDLYAPSKEGVRTLLERLAPAIVIPNYVLDVYDICADAIAAGHDLRCIGMCHADSETEYYTPLAAYEPLIAHFVAVSEQCGRTLSQRIPHRKDDITVLPYGIPVPETLERRYQTDPIRLVYAGRIAQLQKRVMDFVPLVENLSENGTDFIFHIMGEGSREDTAQLKKGLKKLTASGRVVFHGRVSREKMPEMWSAGDVFIQVSDFEGTSISMLEAMSHGVVPVMTKVESGIEGVIEHGKNAFLAPVGDMRGIADCVKELANDSSALRAMGLAAHATSKRFSLEQYGAKFGAVLERTQSASFRRWPEGKARVSEDEGFGLRLPERVDPPQCEVFADLSERKTPSATESGEIPPSQPTGLPEDNILATTEPRFYKVWLADQDPNDPQLNRWVELEAGHLKKGKNRVGELKKHLKVRDARVLDVGCQWGALSIALFQEGATVTGVDVHEPFVEGAKLRAEDNGAEATFLSCPAEDMPFPDASFDVVIGLNIIEHVRSHRETVREMARVLCPGGHLYMDGPNRFSSEFFKKDQHFGLFAVSTFPNWLGQFYVTKIRGFPSYGVGVFPVATIIQRMMTRAELKIIKSSKIPADGSFRGRLKRLWEFNTKPKFFLVARKLGHAAEGAMPPQGD